MSFKNVKIAGSVGLFVAAIITPTLMKSTEFVPFISTMLIVGLVSAISGLFITSTKVLVPVLVGALVAIGSIFAFILYLVSGF